MTKWKTYTVCLISNCEKPVRQFRIPSVVLWTLFVVLIGGVWFASSGIRSYLHLKTADAQARQMSVELAAQQTRIRGQQKQIKAFATEIDRLKDHLLKLNQFEQKIRIIANMEKKGDEGIFGVGGDAPEDINPGLSLTKRHSALIREMHETTRRLEAASERQKTSFEKLLASIENQTDLLASTPSIRPAPGWITSRFAYRISPFTGHREFHHALDIANRKGTPIVSTADGTVSFAGLKWLLGNCVIIDHGHGLVTRYGHMSKVLCKKGEKVKRGEVIGLMGSTGRSTGPHVHYEVYLNDVPVNPEKYILN